MKTPNRSARQTQGAFTVRVVRPHEVEWFDVQLTTYHCPGAGRPAGDYLRQIVERDGCPVALLLWGPGGYALKDRDLSIGWSASQRVERLKLIVQNRRFLGLAAKGQSPNLASQSMGAALRALPDQWREHFGYRPLLAGSFTDPQAHAGTCYKASNGEPAGLLVPPPSGVLPVTQPQRKSLLEVFRRAPDPRDTNTRFRSGPVFPRIAMALLAGRRDTSPRSPASPPP